jgi:predicted acylesterase/phospholipase RssA
MNITQPITDERHLVKEISQLECLIVEALCEDSTWLSSADEAVLRWALSMARVSAVAAKPPAKDIRIGHATDRYRDSLFATLKPLVRIDGTVNKKEIARFIKPIGKLCADERKDLLLLYGAQLSADAFDAAVRSRPLALVLGGGGGTAFVYLGAFELLQQARLYPGAISGASMGALLGAYRARYKEFSLSHLSNIMNPMSFEKVARPFEVMSQFTVPSTFKLHLRELFGTQFEGDNRSLRLSDLLIPLRVAIAGIAHIEGEEDENLEEFAHLLDDGAKSLFKLRREQRDIVSKLIALTRKPLKSIYLGADSLSSDFDVIDALGFSASVPGVFNYDILPDDTRMHSLVTTLMKRHGVYRLIDGGWADNMPSLAAYNAVQEAPGGGRDPFILALDSFAPNYGRHFFFLPLMQMAAQNSKAGRELAHHIITYKQVLSPMNIIPKPEEIAKAVEQGIAETKPHMAFISKMIGPIEDPDFLKKER